jgi:hypothetical protein
MSIQAVLERRLLSQPEFELVAMTHYPTISKLSLPELRDAVRQLRQLHDKSRTISRRQQRELRGKADPRGAEPGLGNANATRRKQVFAQAVKRLNKEIARFAEAEAAPPTLAEAIRKAFEMKRANRAVRHPPSGYTATHGMRANPSTRPTVTLDPREIGRVSEAVKAAQARRDA